MSSKVYLIPNILTQEAKFNSLPGSVLEAIKDVRVFFIEEAKSARALLKGLDSNFPLNECVFFNLNEHTQVKDIKDYLIQAGNRDMAIISEAGYPCVADPGAEVVRLAHQGGMEVMPLSGASSIVLALAASGLGGQNFAFNGYLPKDKQERLKKIKALEQRSAQEHQTQIMMETPYRSQNFLEDLLEVCNPKAFLCVASNITAKDQFIKTTTIEQWKKTSVQLAKKPTLFLLLYFY